uniref:DDE_3 domain-containing protein n=1 Tax=Heterorhabditis bacteriophora TaxID=37862 RepID=A0A1I7X1H4_HETBA
MGFVKANIKCCHLIRKDNMEKRVQFCKKMLDDSEQFMDDDYFGRLRPGAMHPPKIHVCGGISMRGATALTIFPENVRLNSEKYCQIINDIYLPFENIVYNGYARLVQNNAPSHKSAYRKRRFEENNIDCLPWPAESPDLNLVELVMGLYEEPHRGCCKTDKS